MIMFKEMNSDKIYTCEQQEGIKEMDPCCALSLLGSRAPVKDVTYSLYNVLPINISQNPIP